MAECLAPGAGRHFLVDLEGHRRVRRPLRLDWNCFRRSPGHYARWLYLADGLLGGYAVFHHSGKRLRRRASNLARVRVDAGEHWRACRRRSEDKLRRLPLVPRGHREAAQGHRGLRREDAGDLPPREEGHQAARRPLLVEARRVERHAQRRLTRLSKRIAHKARHVAACRAFPVVMGKRPTLAPERDTGQRRAPCAATSPSACGAFPQAFGFRLVAMLNSPFEQQVGALDLLDEVVSLWHCHIAKILFDCAAEITVPLLRVSVLHSNPVRDSVPQGSPRPAARSECRWRSNTAIRHRAAKS